MLRLNIGNTYIPPVEEKKVNTIIESLRSKREELGFIDVDTLVDVQAIEDYAHKVEGDFENVVIFGMGGSALGAKALIEAAHGKYYNEYKNKKGKNIYVLDNIDPQSIDDVERVIDIEKTLFCFISKSGTTIEPISQYLYFREKLQAYGTRHQEKNIYWKKHFCFVVGENCAMKKDLEKDFQVFCIPETTGGRFSVFTAVGLVPLAFSGVNIGEYLKGVQESRELFFSPDLSKNSAFHSALIISYYYKEKGITDSVLFNYSSRLFQFGEWYKQLLAESIGKDENGITPISSVGASDQHSELQLYQDGPKNKIFTFLSIKDSGVDPLVYPKFEDLTFKKLLDIYEYGTRTSLAHEDHPVMRLELRDLSEKTLGSLLYMYMFQTAYLGEILGVNAFDQPGVEKSKSFAREKTKQDFGDLDLYKKAFYEGD